MAKCDYTVIVPSFRGGEYLKKCVRSVLAQTYGGFELAVLDNSSNDGSAEWLASLHDNRIKVYTSAKQLSIEDNWARALTIPKQMFMTFFGHDDLMDPNYLEVMGALIRRQPEASLYFSQFRYIDDQDHITGSCRPLPARETAAEYVAALFSGTRDTYGCGYVMRSSLYNAVGGIPNFRGLLFADDALWISLMSRSWKATAAAECFSVRQHPKSASSAAKADWAYAMEPYITFLEDFSLKDEAFAAAYKEHAPSYFQSICWDVYLTALVRATSENRPLDEALRAQIFQQLSRVSTAALADMRRSSHVALHEIINRFSVARSCYRFYSAGRTRHALPLSSNGNGDVSS